MAKIIGISGQRGAGKSLLGNPYLVRRGFHIMALADPLKEDVRKAYNIGVEYTDGKLKEIPTDKLAGRTPRDAMIAEGKLRREFSNGMYWLDRTFDKIKKLAPDDKVAITDVRFLNEAEYIREKGGIIVRLERDPNLNIYKGKLDDPSETELNDYKHFTLVLPQEKNRTPQDLEKFADELITFLEKIKG